MKPPESWERKRNQLKEPRCFVRKADTECLLHILRKGEPQKLSSLGFGGGYGYGDVGATKELPSPQAWSTAVKIPNAPGSIAKNNTKQLDTLIVIVLIFVFQQRLNHQAAYPISHGFNCQTKHLCLFGVLGWIDLGSSRRSSSAKGLDGSSGLALVAIQRCSK